MTLIKYGISREYLPDWGIQEALREVYQNFQDYGIFKEEFQESDETAIIDLSNDYKVEDCQFLKIGESNKRLDSSSVGKHGEGLKMAALVFKREGATFEIYFGKGSMPSTLVQPVWYEDETLGTCFGFEKKKIPEETLGFRVHIQIPTKEAKKYFRKKLSDKDVIYRCPIYGELLNRPKGEVYVDGHYVGQVDGIKYSYNFKPKHIPLDRDRRVPKSFDVYWYASQILSDWEGLSPKDMDANDTQYIGTIPKKIVKAFKPSMTKDGIVFRSGGTQASSEIAKGLMNDPINKKRIAKIRYNLTRKRVPHSILKEFFDQYYYTLNEQAKIDADVLLQKAKGWKIKE